jgi:hypothetical protein
MEQTTKQDTITQLELQALAAVYSANDLLCLCLRHRLETGATVEPGPYRMESSGESMEEAEECAATGRLRGFVNCGVDITLPETEPEEDLDNLEPEDGPEIDPEE